MNLIVALKRLLSKPNHPTTQPPNHLPTVLTGYHQLQPALNPDHIISSLTLANRQHVGVFHLGQPADEGPLFQISSYNIYLN